jgi:hypothetical protein
MSKPAKTKPRNLGEALTSVVTKATGKWTATTKSEERRPSYVSYRRVRMTAARGLSQKDAAAQMMEAAYLAASANDDRAEVCLIAFAGLQRESRR